MPTSDSKSPDNSRFESVYSGRRHIAGRAGFTIIEVAMAGTVLFLALLTSLGVSQKCLRMIDTARNTAIAGQILQSLNEDLRTLTFTSICNVTNVAGDITAMDLPGGSHYMSNSFLTAGNGSGATVLSRYTFTRTVTDISASAYQYPTVTSKTMELIKLTATWKGIDGRSHTVSTIGYYALNGIYAYYVS